MCKVRRRLSTLHAYSYSDMHAVGLRHVGKGINITWNVRSNIHIYTLHAVCKRHTCAHMACCSYSLQLCSAMLGQATLKPCIRYVVSLSTCPNIVNRQRAYVHIHVCVSVPLLESVNEVRRYAGILGGRTLPVRAP